MYVSFIHIRIRRQTLREVKGSGSGQIVIDCQFDHIRTVLKQAQAVGMMTHYYDYMLTSLDMHTIDLEDFKYGGTNITSFRLVDPDNPEVVNVVRSWILGEKRFPSRVSDNQIPFIKVGQILRIFHGNPKSISCFVEIGGNTGAFYWTLGRIKV